MDSPFLTHSRKIKSVKDIQLLEKSGAKVVTIDPNKGVDLTEDKDGEAKAASEAEAEPAESPEATPELSPLSLEKEMSAAINVRSKIKKAVTDLQNDLGAGRKVSIEKLSPLLDQTLESLERNNQALLNLAHLSQRSQKLADHTFSTYCIALNLAQRQSVPPEEIEALGIAALVHEAGWAQLPLQLMGKRKPYTAMEVKLLEKHPQVGIDSLRKSELPELSLRIVHEHHELCDGSGYPQQLKKDDIHYLSRLFSIVDRYDEMVHQLTDQPGMLPTNALRALYMQGEKGIYDKEAISSLISLLGIYPVSTAVRLNSGAKGIVREVPQENHLMPVVELHYDAKGKELSTPIRVSLAEQTNDEELVIETVINPCNAKDDPARRLFLDI